MSYTTRLEIAAMVPEALMARALDADGDGGEDAGRFDAILAVVEGEVDGLLAPAYDVPFAVAPAAVADAVRKIVCERLYMLNSTTAKDNPWTTAAAEARERLGRTGAGALALSLSDAPAQGGIDDDELAWALGNQDGM